MNINQLKYVIEVSSASSMREASRKLYISQPALSNSIKELEDELGILIFERTNKGLILTKIGKDIYDEIDITSFSEIILLCMFEFSEEEFIYILQ